MHFFDFRFYPVLMIGIHQLKRLQKDIEYVSMALSCPSSNKCLLQLIFLTMQSITLTVFQDKYIISSMFFLTIVCTWHGFIIVINNIARRYGLTVYSNLEMLVLIILSGGYGMFNIGFAIIIYVVVSPICLILSHQDSPKVSFNTGEY